MKTVRPKLPVTFGRVAGTVSAAAFLWLMAGGALYEYSENGQIGNLPQGNISGEAPIVIMVLAVLAALYTYLSYAGFRKYLNAKRA